MICNLVSSDVQIFFILVNNVVVLMKEKINLMINEKNFFGLGNGWLDLKWANIKSYPLTGSLGNEIFYVQPHTSIERFRNPTITDTITVSEQPHVTSSLSVIVNANSVESCFEKRVQLVQVLGELSEFKLN